MKYHKIYIYIYIHIEFLKKEKILKLSLEKFFMLDKSKTWIWSKLNVILSSLFIHSKYLPPTNGQFNEGFHAHLCMDKVKSNPSPWNQFWYNRGGSTSKLEFPEAISSNF